MRQLKAFIHYTDEPYQIEHLAPLLNENITAVMGKTLPDNPDYHILFTSHPDEQLLTASPNIEALIHPWAGVPPKTVALMQKFPHITFHNSHHNAILTAEFAVALLMSASKRVIPIDQKLRRGDWTERYQNKILPPFLYGQTALVMGYGNIGKHIAKCLKGIGMNVWATRRSADEIYQDEIAKIHPSHMLHELLPKADAVLLAMPLTEDTRGIIGKSELDLMRDTATLVNVSRGVMIDQEALYNGLKERVIHAAGIDVWYIYPGDSIAYPDDDPAAQADTFPADFPFNELDNIVMSPHRADLTADTERLRMVHYAHMLNTYASGKPMPNRVNLDAGY